MPLFNPNPNVGSGGGESWLPASPLESPDGARVIFTTPSDYIAGNLFVWLNGVLERVTESSANTFTFSEAPRGTDLISLFYRTA